MLKNLTTDSLNKLNRNEIKELVDLMNSRAGDKVDSQSQINVFQDDLFIEKNQNSQTIINNVSSFFQNNGYQWNKSSKTWIKVRETFTDQEIIKIRELIDRDNDDSKKDFSYSFLPTGIELLNRFISMSSRSDLLIQTICDSVPDLRSSTILENVIIEGCKICNFELTEKILNMSVDEINEKEQELLKMRSDRVKSKQTTKKKTTRKKTDKDIQMSFDNDNDN